MIAALTDKIQKVLKPEDQITILGYYKYNIKAVCNNKSDLVSNKCLIIHLQHKPHSMSPRSTFPLWHFLRVHLVASILVVVFRVGRGWHSFIGSSVTFSQRPAQMPVKSWASFQDFFLQGFYTICKIMEYVFRKLCQRMYWKFSEMSFFLSLVTGIEFNFFLIMCLKSSPMNY